MANCQGFLTSGNWHGKILQLAGKNANQICYLKPTETTWVLRIILQAVSCGYMHNFSRTLVLQGIHWLDSKTYPIARRPHPSPLVQSKALFAVGLGSIPAHFLG